MPTISCASCRRWWGATMATDGLLTFADGEVRLGNTLLPGVLFSQAIRNSVRFDRSERDGLSGKSKVPLGWDDAEITLQLELLTDKDGDCYEKLTVLNKIFRDVDKGANPKIYTVTNRHARARGISRVVFSGLDSDEDDREDTILATMTFTEHVPPVVKREKQVAASTKALGSGSAKAPAVAAKPTAAPAITTDSDSAFSAGFKAGMK